MTQNDKINVICVETPYSYGEYISDYHVGKIYAAKYLYDRIRVGDDVMEFEWMVYLEEHNHYQFSDVEFKRYFRDIIKERDKKISYILNI